ncbi:MAG: HAD-IIA family hydrolase [Candidatus Heimdallarchaeota archaeon]|nr:HAD-IIA family hydrolase [Candidatus Heimdallarchaeota archaeon]
MNSRIENAFNEIDAWLFDGDGVLYKENEPLPGALEVLTILQEQQKEVFLLTNNSTKTRVEFQEKLSSMGVELEEKRILTSAFLTAKFISDESPNASVYVIGEGGLKKELKDSGLRIVNNYPEKNDEDVFDFEFSDIDYVVTGMDRNLNYVKIARAMNILGKSDPSARFIATNADITFPTIKGLVPGGGAMIDILEKLSGKKVEKIVGKPQPLMYEIVVDMAKCPKEKVMMFGDRLETDIVGAKNFGILACFVNSGTSSLDELVKMPSGLSPDVIISSLSDILKEIRKSYS